MEGYGVEFNVEKVRRLMTEQGYSANKFAELLGWHTSQMHKLLRIGRARPQTLDQIAYQLGCTIADLLPEEESNRINEINVMLDDGAFMPTRAHDDDAGLDLYSPVCFVVPGDPEWNECYAEVDTGVHIQIPKGYVGDVKSKSGLMMNDNITTDGTVDAGYTGSVRVKLFNHGLNSVRIEKGQKIAQLVIKKIITPKPVLVTSFEKTERGANGFGSSGKF